MATATIPAHPQAMPEAEILSTARTMLAEHGHAYVKVSMSGRMTRSFGMVYSRRSDGKPLELKMSRPLTRTNDRWRTLETIRHEVAHVIANATAGRNVGHGPEWKAACALTGATPRRCYTGEDTTTVHRGARYEGICTACGDTVGTRKVRPATNRRYWHNACPTGTRRPAIRWQTATTTNASQEGTIMAKHYRYVVTDPVGIEHTDTRARKDDAIKAAKKAALKEGGVRWIVYTPAGEVSEEWHADTPQSKKAAAPAPPAPDDEPVTAAAPAQDKAYRRDRIPAGATEHTCTTCGKVLPVTKFPTTRDKSRLTECRGCRDSRRAKA